MPGHKLKKKQGKKKSFSVTGKRRVVKRMANVNHQQLLMENADLRNRIWYYIVGKYFQDTMNQQQQSIKITDNKFVSQQNQNSVLQQQQQQQNSFVDFMKNQANIMQHNSCTTDDSDTSMMCTKTQSVGTMSTSSQTMLKGHSAGVSDVNLLAAKNSKRRAAGKAGVSEQGTITTRCSNVQTVAGKTGALKKIVDSRDRKDDEEDDDDDDDDDEDDEEDDDDDDDEIDEIQDKKAASMQSFMQIFDNFGLMQGLFQHSQQVKKRRLNPINPFSMP